MLCNTSSVPSMKKQKKQIKRVEQSLLFASITKRTSKSARKPEHGRTARDVLCLFLSLPSFQSKSKFVSSNENERQHFAKGGKNQIRKLTRSHASAHIRIPTLFVILNFLIRESYKFKLDYFRCASLASHICHHFIRCITVLCLNILSRRNILLPKIQFQAHYYVERATRKCQSTIIAHICPFPGCRFVSANTITIRWHAKDSQQK